MRAGKRTLGRPRRLTIEQIIEATLAIGVSKMTMQSVADYLGVGKPLLYGYFDSREDLVRAAHARASQRLQMPEDTGQPWPLWILEYAVAVFDLLTTDGDLLEAWIEGASPPAADVNSLIMWVEVLGRHGFSETEALQLRLAVSHLVIGAAASNKHRRAQQKAGRPYENRLRTALEQSDQPGSGLLLQFMELLGRDIEPGNWEHALYLLLAGTIHSRRYLGANVNALPFADLAGS